MAFRHLEHSFSQSSPEIDYDLYFPDHEDEPESAVVGRISLKLVNNEQEYLLGSVAGVFWHALEFVDWDLEDKPVCLADANQINFYLPSKDSLASLGRVLGLVKGYCEVNKIHLQLNCFYSHSNIPTIRNTYINAGRQQMHNLYLMQPDFMSAVRVAQWREAQQFSQQGHIYQTSTDVNRLGTPFSVKAKHGITYYGKIENMIPSIVDADFLKFSKQSYPIPVSEVNPQFPRLQTTLFKVDMNNGSKRILTGEAPKYMTNGVVSDLLHQLPLPAQHGDVHEEAYFGYLPWDAFYAIFKGTTVAPQVLELLRNYNYKLIAYPASAPVVFEGYETGKRTISYPINTTVETGLEGLAKRNGSHVAYIPPTLLVR